MSILLSFILALGVSLCTVECSRTKTVGSLTPNARLGTLHARTVRPPVVLSQRCVTCSSRPSEGASVAAAALPSRLAVSAVAAVFRRPQSVQRRQGDHFDGVTGVARSSVSGDGGLTSEYMKLVVRRPAGKDFEVEVKNEDTVGLIKVLVQAETKIAPADQELTFASAALTDDMRVEACGLKAGSVLELAVSDTTAAAGDSEGTEGGGNEKEEEDDEPPVFVDGVQCLRLKVIADINVNKQKVLKFDVLPSDPMGNLKEKAYERIGNIEGSTFFNPSNAYGLWRARAKELDQVGKPDERGRQTLPGYPKKDRIDEQKSAEEVNLRYGDELRWVFLPTEMAEDDE